MITFRQLSQCIAEAFRSWWAVDRIRVSPCTGRLPGLAVGDCVQIRDGIYTVVDRQVQADRYGLAVHFRLTDHCEQAAELTVISSHDENPAAGELHAQGTAVAVFDDDVVIMKRAVPAH